MLALLVFSETVYRSGRSIDGLGDGGWVWQVDPEFMQ
jgi:hypothetical protein